MRQTAPNDSPNWPQVLHSLFSTCNDGIILADQDLEIRYANDRAKDICNGDLDLFSKTQDNQIWSLSSSQKHLITADEDLPLRCLMRGEAIADEIFHVQFRNTQQENLLSLSGHLIEDVPPWGYCGLLIARDITPRKRHYECNECHSRRVWRDELTGSLNRSLFLEQVEIAFKSAKRHDESCFALLFIDVDRFKTINDSFGHAIGDLLLINIAKRIQDSLRVDDVLARLGGDEFAVLLKDISSRPEVVEIVEAIIEQVSSIYCLGNHKVYVDISVGITLYNSQYRAVDELIRDADIAMYKAKTEPEIYYKFFEPIMEITDNDALRLEVDLRHALEKQEFVLHYQPIVSIKSQETIGYEALVRWKHPDRGLLLPGNFISIAETTGLIVPLGWWVLQEACQQMKQWISKFPGTESWFVSVNMSSKQFSQKYAVESIQSILERTQLSGRNLKLEVTESILISHSDSIISKLERIRDMGIKLAIDDFGTGYSSLSYLHRFPFDFLKIDRSFIEGADTDYEKLEILQSVVRLAWNLGLEVVAEGIETPKNHAQLKALNCEFGQGYLFSRPAEAKAIEATLAR
jgi:diguanylate cyclase (GGDEF)-like protein